MENIILSRDSYINEIYSKKSEEEINEGLLDFFKTVLGKEWKSIKSKNASIKKALQEVDKSLGGFSFMKMGKAGTCKEIRQVVCDFANDLFKAKMKEFEDGKKLQKTLIGLKNADEVTNDDKKQIENAGKVTDYLRKYDLKDKSLIDKLETHEKRIKTICNGDINLKKYADLLMGGVRNIINDHIIKEYEKTEKDKKNEDLEAAKKRLEDQKKEEAKARKEINDKEKKKEEKHIKELEKERADLMSKVGVSPLKNENGVDAIETLSSEFSNIYKAIIKENHKYSFDSIINESKEKKISKEVKQALGGDIYFGLEQLTKTPNVNDDMVKLVLKEMKLVFDIIDETLKTNKEAKDIPSDSIQAMFLGLSKLIQTALIEKTAKLDDNVKNILARCAIDSDKTIGYGLPLLNPQKPKEGNIFVGITQRLIDAEGKSAEVIGDNKDLLNQFRQNMSRMFGEIRKTAEELIDAKEKEDEKES